MDKLEAITASLFAGWTVYKLGGMRADLHSLREAWRAKSASDNLMIAKLDQEIRKLKGEESSYVELAKGSHVDSTHD